MMVGNNMPLTPMLVLTDAEIDSYINYGLRLNERYERTAVKKRARNRREKRRDECQYERYADDWEREGDAY